MSRERRKSRKRSRKGDEIALDASCTEEETTYGVNFVRKCLKQRYFGGDKDNFRGYGKHYEENLRELSSILKQCIEFGESNSAIVIGPRGSGKSKLIDDALNAFNESNQGDFFTVNLNGYLQTDDRSSLQEIARQLQLENVIDDRVMGSFAENLAFILQTLQSGDKKAKPIVMVLDEFDLFAQHKNQSLIYNLLDVARSKNAPISVIGVTCRLDVMELLEKRVKSRYSNRSILAFNKGDFDDYMYLFRELLTIKEVEKGNLKFITEWNNSLTLLANDKGTKDTLKKLFSLKKESGSLIQLLAIPICRLSPWQPFITPQMLAESYSQQYRDSKAAMLHGISVLELCLLIASKHVVDRKQGEAFNFEMVYKEYQNFIHKKVHTVQRFGKDIAMKAFEHLLAIEFVRSVDGVGHSSTPKEFKLTVLLLEDSHIATMIKEYEDCPTELHHWAMSMFA